MAADDRGNGATISSHRMSPRALNELLEKRLIANLATFDPDGRIHLVPLRFLREGGIPLPTGSGTHKVRNVTRHPHASALIHKAVSGSDVTDALIRGPVEVIRGTEAMELNRAIHLRYITAKGFAHPAVAETFAADDVTLSMEMAEIITWDHRGSEVAGVLREPGNAYPVG